MSEVVASSILFRRLSSGSPKIGVAPAEYGAIPQRRGMAPVLVFNLAPAACMIRTCGALPIQPPESIGHVQVSELEILFEDNHCLAVAKPAGIATTHFAGKEETLDLLVKSYLKEKYQKPGNVFLGIVHRLDKPVSGVLLFARTSKAASRLAAQFRQGSVEKVYWAVVEGKLTVQAGSFDDWLKKHPGTGRVKVVSPGEQQARQALLHFTRLGEYCGLTLLELRPQTGRRHQLRTQLASRGHPIYGDAKYGSVHTFKAGIGLHARSLTFLHPIRNEPITLRAELPKSWRGKFAYLLREAGR
jgi:23S rRNA pseudouridine1911/1915/1917 synthase